MTKALFNKHLQSTVFTFSILLVFSNVKAQSYLPLLQEKTEWHFTTCFNGCGTDVYFVEDDTLISGKNYKILDGYHYISRSFLVREDTANRKVYFVFLNNGKLDPEILLYDFALIIGDSVKLSNPISPFPSAPGYYTLDSIASRMVQNSQQRRFFYLSANDPNTAFVNGAVWVEGIGSLSLINAPGGFPDVNDVGKVSCVFKNGELIYHQADSIAECNEVYNLSNTNTYPLNYNLNIYPTLVRNRIHIEGETEIAMLQILNAQGLNCTLQSWDKSPPGKLELKLNHLANGPYILQLVDKNGKRSSHKFYKL